MDSLFTSSWAVFKSLETKPGGTAGSRAGRVNTAGLKSWGMRWLNSPAQLSFETLLPFFHIFLCRLKCFITKSEIWLESWLRGKARGCSVGINPFKLLLVVLLGVWSLFPPSLLEQPLTDSVHPYCWNFFPSRDIFLRWSLQAWKLLAGRERNLPVLHRILLSLLIFFSALVRILSCRQSFYLCFILLHFWLSWSTACSVWALPMI